MVTDRCFDWITSNFKCLSCQEKIRHTLGFTSRIRVSKPRSSALCKPIKQKNNAQVSIKHLYTG